MHELEQRIAALESAQRNTGAQLTALNTVFTAVAPFLCQKSAELRGALNRAYDTTSSLMDSGGLDRDYQGLVLTQIRQLSEMIYEGYKPDPHHKSPAPDVPPVP